MSEFVLQFGVALTASGVIFAPLFIPIDYEIERAVIMLALGVTSFVSSCAYVVFGS